MESIFISKKKRSDVGAFAFDQAAVGVVVVGGSTLGCAAADRGNGVRVPRGRKTRASFCL